MLNNINWLHVDKLNQNNMVNNNVVCLNLNTWRQCTRDKNYQDIFLSSNVLCDGFWTATLARLLNHQVKQFSGPDFFIKQILQGNFQRHCIIGSTTKKQNGLERFLKKNNFSKILYKKPLDYLEVDQFDYNEISDYIHENAIDMAWVSLGAPKQEYFITNLRKNFEIKYPEYNNLCIAAVGAAIDFYSETNIMPRAPKRFRKLGLEWLWRIFYQPKKTLKRLFYEVLSIPKIIFIELKNE